MAESNGQQGQPGRDGRDGRDGSAWVKMPGFAGGVSGQWGAVLILVTVTCVLLLVGTGYGMYTFNDTLQTSTRTHDAILTLLNDLKEQEKQSQCLSSLPIGDPRIAALRYEDPCIYALYVWVPPAGSIVPAAKPRPPAPARKGFEAQR